MNLLGILTLVAFGLVIAALAVYLVTIAVLLRKTLSTLGSINVALRAIAERVEPLEELVTGINAELAPARDALQAGTEKAKQKVGSPNI